MTTRFVGEKLHHVERGVARPVVLRENDHRRGADEAVVGLQGIEIERNVRERGRKDAAGGAARQIGVELMLRRHAASVFVDQLTYGDARRREVHTGFVHPARDRKRAQALAPVPAVAREPFGTLFHNVANPVQRFQVVLERRPPEQADLRNVRRAQPRHPALALDRLDHRRLLAADVGARAAAQFDRRQGARRVGSKRSQFAGQDRATACVFVAQVDIDRVDTHGPRRDQHAFEKTVWIAFEVVAILERARLTFVDVDRHEARRGLAANDAPLASRRKTRAAEAAQR